MVFEEKYSLKEINFIPTWPESKEKNNSILNTRFFLLLF